MSAPRRPKTVVVGCFMHETNTFSVRPTDWASFTRGGGLWLEGDAVHAGVAGTNTETAGFFEVFRLGVAGDVQRVGGL